jgi:glycerol uptake facilitator-like aquaporin
VTLGRKLAAEALGTALLLAAVVGSGIMAERLSGGNVALALLANTIATGCALAVLISIFAPISGAHFNPAVTLFFALRGEMKIGTAILYAAVQFVAAIAGVWLAHLMFAMPVFEIAHKLRDGPGQALSEFVATFGLIATIACAVRFGLATTPFLVGLYISAAYWFTASTSFANPAVTVARALSDSFAGIAPHSAPAFIAAEIVGVGAAFLVFGWLLKEPVAER